MTASITPRKRGRPNTVKVRPHKIFVASASPISIKETSKKISEILPQLSSVEIQELAHIAQKHRAMTKLQRHGPRTKMVRGRRANTHIASLIHDVAKLLAKNNGTTLLHELNSISGYEEERALVTGKPGSKLAELTRAILKATGQPYVQSLRQQTLQAKKMRSH